MRRKRVEEILLPYKEGIPLEPSVRVGDKIIHAIELMVSNNLKCIAVLQNKRPVGMVRLEDAFQEIGLHVTEERSNR
jgi:predicted transcriptional regulator